MFGLGELSTGEGGIYSGMLTATESAAVAVVWAAIAGAFIYRELNLPDAIQIIKDSAKSSAMILFIIAASTDKIDGWMARKYNQVTEMGKLMDPIADKLLTCGAMIVCSAFGELGWWVTILFLIREIGITVMRFFVMERPGGKVIAAAWPGKLKTVFQCVGLSMLLLPFWSLGNGKPRRSG